MDIMLDAGEMLCLDGERQGLQLNCLAGKLWITQEGDSRDHVLSRGDCFQSRCRGRIIATARIPVRLGIERPRVQLPVDWQPALPLRLTIAR